MPKGLYLIKSGQCNVSKVIIAERRHNLEEVVGARRLLNDKNPLFHHFDAENSFLNNVKF